MKNYLLFLSLSLLIFSCEDSDTAGNYEFEQHSSKTINPNGSNQLNLENTNGVVTIIGSDTATHFHFDVVKRVKSYRSSTNAEDHINDIVISYGQYGDVIEVKVDHPNDNKLDYEIEFTITGPIIFDYKIIEGNGNVDINSVSRNLQVTVGNGNTNADVILLNNCSVKLETGNGNVSLTIPGITDAQLTATVGNGTITKSNLPFENEISTNKTFHGILGNGEGNILITLGNGNVMLNGY